MRPIDAEELIECLTELESFIEQECNHEQALGISRAIHDVLCAPTVDAVPVIRCADCKYLNENIKVGEWDGSCRHWNTHSVKYSWFCSQAKRREHGKAY